MENNTVLGSYQISVFYIYILHSIWHANDSFFFKSDFYQIWYMDHGC